MVEYAIKYRGMAPDPLESWSDPRLLMWCPGDGGASQTFELKLTGTPSSVHAAFQDLAGSPPGLSKVVGTFYDTRDGRVGGRGFSLQLQQRRGGYEVVLRREDRPALKRDEWTARTRQPVVDLGLLPQGAPRSELGLVLPEELEPQFSVEAERTRTRHRDRGAVIEASLDIGRIIAGPRERPLTELQLTLVRGSPLALLKRLRSMVLHHGLSVCTGSEVVRGRELAKGGPPAWVKSDKPKLQVSDSIERAVREVLATAAAQIVGNLEAAADGRDEEGVHQLRVALRRLRTALSIFRTHLVPAASLLDEEAKWALKLLGRARDLDVFLSETAPPVLRGNPDMSGLKTIVETAEAQKREAYAAVRQLVMDPGFNCFLVDLQYLAIVGGLVEPSCEGLLGPAAEALLRKRHKKALKIGKQFDRLTNAQRHEVRIALKKLRYACDYFQGLYPEETTKTYLKRLAALQDDLGRLNDATVAKRMVDDLAADDADAALGAALIKGWYGHRLEAVEPHMLTAWRQFARAQPFWRAASDKGQVP